MSIPAPEDRPGQCAKFVDAVVAGRSVAAIAEAAGICRRSVSNWRKRKGINRRIEEALARIREAHECGILDAAEKARNALVNIVEQGTERNRLGAATVIIGEVRKIIERSPTAAFAETPEVDLTGPELYEQFLAIRRRHSDKFDAPNTNGNGSGHTFPHNGKSHD